MYSMEISTSCSSRKTMRPAIALVATASWAFALLLAQTDAFAGVGLPAQHPRSFTLSVGSSSNVDTASSTKTSILSLSLPKPLGMILEEIEENKAEGVYIKEFGDSGSAVAYAEQLSGAKLSSVQGNDVTRETFDTVMDTIINAPDTVDLEFVIRREDCVDGENSEDTSSASPLPIGTTVTIQVDGISIEAKVGDNLRTTLLENEVEVYQGLKQKLGNCGGGGQCTFCAFDFIESGEGWLERSEYEDQKLAKWPKARLACLSNIQGPATIKKTQR